MSFTQAFQGTQHFFYENPMFFYGTTLVFLIAIFSYFFRSSEKSAEENASKKRNNLNEASFKKKRIEWGYEDTEFVMRKDGVVLTGDHYSISGQNLPNFKKFILKKADIEESDILDGPKYKQYFNEALKRLAEFKKNRVNTLEKSLPENIFKSSQFSTDALDILTASMGQTNYEVIKCIYVDPNNDFLKDQTYDAVFTPLSKEEIVNFVKNIVEYNQKKDTNSPSIKIVPKGGGTNVTRCLLVERRENEIFICIDMSEYKGMVTIDKKNNKAVFRSGTIGRILEEELEKDGYTFGHEPDSAEFSSLGGWISTNASGMKAGLYGNIENLVLSFTLVCPNDPENIITVGHDYRTSSGPDISKSLFGIEGSCFIILDVTISIRKLSDFREYDSLVLPDWKTGCDFLRAVRESGPLPASLRMVDNDQFQFGQALKPEKTTTAKVLDGIKKKALTMMGYELDKICACTIVYEGSKDECESTRNRINKICKKYGGMSGGSENGKAGYRLTNSIANIRDFADKLNICGDTFETTVFWEDLPTTGDNIAKNLAKTHAELKEKYPDVLKGNIFVSYRATQFYNTCVCLYTTYAYYCYHFEHYDEIQSAIEDTLKRTVIECNASLSHHHGIGKLKKDCYNKQFEFNKNVAKSLQQAFDRDNIICARNNAFE